MRWPFATRAHCDRLWESNIVLTSWEEIFAEIENWELEFRLSASLSQAPIQSRACVQFIFPRSIPHTCHRCWMTASTAAPLHNEEIDHTHAIRNKMACHMELFSLPLPRDRSYSTSMTDIGLLTGGVTMDMFKFFFPPRWKHMPRPFLWDGWGSVRWFIGGIVSPCPIFWPVMLQHHSGGKNGRRRVLTAIVGNDV